MLTDKRKEKISAFLDNDMHRDELMSFSLSAEPADAEMARRYQMVGDTLRGEMSDACFVDVSHAVREALVGEESYANNAIQQSATNNTEADNTTADNTDGSRGFFDLSAWFRPVAGMAVAASVAVVMVVTVSQQDVDGLSPVANSPVANNVATQPAIQVAADDKIKLQNAAKVQQVDQRLVNQHLEYATQDTLQGRLPLVRAVSYEAEK